MAPEIPATSSRTRSIHPSPLTNLASSPWPTQAPVPPVAAPTAVSSSSPSSPSPSSTESTRSSASAMPTPRCLSPPLHASNATRTTNRSPRSSSTGSPSCAKDSPCLRFQQHQRQRRPPLPQPLQPHHLTNLFALLAREGDVLISINQHLTARRTPTCQR